MPDVKGLGAKADQEKRLAASLKAAEDANEKAKFAKSVAERVKSKETTLKALITQLDLLQAEKTRLSGLRTFYQNNLNNLILSNASEASIAAAKKLWVDTDNSIKKVDTNIAKKAKEYGDAANNGKVSARAGAAQFRKEAKVRQQLAKAKTDRANPNGSKNTKEDTDGANENPIRFNAPMVRSAYFGTNHHSTKYLTAKGALPPAASQLLADLGNFGDGQTNRGFIIPNKRSQEAALSKLDAKDKAIVGGYKVPYGFRFHYNPQFVTQSYGSITGISPELLESGKDKTNMITTPASSSSISITLYLNRIEDMNALANFNVQEPSYFAPINSDEKSLKYYPEIVSASDRKLIKDFGTMYDLDFLFKAINGDMGGYKSPLRGIETGDVGWLNGIAVEVHMGRKLRYLARVTNISVNHVQFTENMVPTLTTVVLTMARFHDAMVKD